MPVHVADMLELNRALSNKFDAVICLDNALSHLLSEADVAQAAAQIRVILRAGGKFVASIRDYDEIVRERPVVQGSALFLMQGTKDSGIGTMSFDSRSIPTLHARVLLAGTTYMLPQSTARPYETSS